MQKIIVMILGLALTIGFTGLFYKWQEHNAPSSPPVAQAEATEKYSTQPQARPNFDPLEIRRVVTETKEKIAVIDQRSAELEVERTSLKDRKEELKHSLKTNQSMAELFESDSVFPSSSKARGVIANLASTVAESKEKGESKPFVQIQATSDSALIHLEAERLFGHSNPSLLRVTQTKRLADVMDRLPAGAKLQHISIYQSAENRSGQSLTRLKSLEDYMQAKFGAGVDEIQVHLTKRNLIPHGSDFLLEFKVAVDSDHDTAVPQSEAK